MASEGVIFKQAYTSSPVCSPSRASLISGQYPHNHGVLINTHIAPAWTGGLGENKITFITTLQWLSLDHESISSSIQIVPTGMSDGLGVVQMHTMEFWYIEE